MIFFFSLLSASEQFMKTLCALWYNILTSVLTTNDHFLIGRYTLCHNVLSSLSITNEKLMISLCALYCSMFSLLLPTSAQVSNLFSHCALYIVILLHFCRPASEQWTIPLCTYSVLSFLLPTSEDKWSFHFALYIVIFFHYSLFLSTDEQLIISFFTSEYHFPASLLFTNWAINETILLSVS